MRVMKGALKDCTQLPDLEHMADVLSMPCRMDCGSCGFYRPVAAERLRRIRAHDWSFKRGTETGKEIAYLQIKTQAEGGVET